MTDERDELDSLGQFLDQLDVRWDNLDFSEALNASIEAGNAYKKFQRRKKRELMNALIPLYRMILLMELRKTRDDVRALLKKANVQTKNGSDLHGAILRWHLGVGHEAASRWASALKYAASKATEPEELVEFFKAEGGLNKSAKMWRELTKGIQPPTQTRAKDAKPKPKPSGPKIAGVEFFATDDCAQQIRDLARRASGGRVVISAKIKERGKVLTLRSVKIQSRKATRVERKRHNDW